MRGALLALAGHLLAEALLHAPVQAPQPPRRSLSRGTSHHFSGRRGFRRAASTTTAAARGRLETTLVLGDNLRLRLLPTPQPEDCLDPCVAGAPHRCRRGRGLLDNPSPRGHVAPTRQYRASSIVESRPSHANPGCFARSDSRTFRRGGDSLPRRTPSVGPDERQVRLRFIPPGRFEAGLTKRKFELPQQVKEADARAPAVLRAAGHAGGCGITKLLSAPEGSRGGRHCHEHRPGLGRADAERRAIGFETVEIAPPLPMAIDVNEGQRRFLCGRSVGIIGRVSHRAHPSSRSSRRGNRGGCGARFELSFTTPASSGSC